MPKYTYQPLDKPASEFRLLQISKDPLTHQPQCSLQKYSLVDCPRYTALSYTWGEPTPTRSVAIDRANLEVRQNLFDFLRAYTIEAWGIYDLTRPVFFWIDQICINQEDVIERSDQVRIMDKIYKRAKMVLVWLGCNPTVIEAARRLRDKEDDYSGWSVFNLTTHPYFSRIWILQEIALSVNPPLIVCRGVELSLDRVSFAALQIQPLLPGGAFGLMRRVSTVRDGQRRTLEECIRSHFRSKCLDPRDKVYGLLGLTPERWRVRVDYTKSVLEVYLDAVAALYEELFDLADPECLYPESLRNQAIPLHYNHTLFDLGVKMDLPRKCLLRLDSFLKYIQVAYLSTKIRNVQYTYAGRIYTRVPAQSSSEKILEPEEEIEVSWGSITATRRNPLMRDIIPEMGFQFQARTTAKNTIEQSGDSVPARARWWCKHDGEMHYFDCVDSPDGSKDKHQRFWWG